MKDSTAGSAAPLKFYKYRAMAGEAAKWVERIVGQHEIYFAPASSFNDPFDLRPPFSLEASKEVQSAFYVGVARKNGSPQSEEELWAEARRTAEDSLSEANLPMTTFIVQALHTDFITNKVGVFCVSTKRDDILMWSHYGDSHRGICLEFDGMAPLMGHAQRVTYSQQRPIINPYVDDNMVALEKAMLTKSDHWKYESEWRLFRNIKGPGIETIRPKNLTGIIIGAAASAEVRQTVFQWARERSAPLSVYQAAINKREFVIDISPLAVPKKRESNHQ